MSEETIRQFQEFFDERMQAQVSDLLASYPDQRSIVVDFSVLSSFDDRLADNAVLYPDAFLKDAEEALKRKGLLAPGEKAFSPTVRIFNLPNTFDVSIQHLGSEHLGKLFRVEGVASWVTEIKPLMKTALWQCLHCESQVKTLSEKSVIKPPGLCKCGRKDFKLLEQSSEFKNLQRAQVQELVEKVRGNTPTAHVELWMEDDLTNCVTPGEKFVVTGILRLQAVRDRRGTKSSVYAKFLDVVHLQRMEREFEEIVVSKEEEEQILSLAKNPRLFELVVGSIAPSIYGYKELKQAIALQLFGGTPNKVLPDGKKIRSDVHLLLIGDPGTAKSSILQYVANLAPKSVFVSGESATSVGLTASAEKDSDGEGWILKAGAMVLANGGLAIIDEFDKMSEWDRGAIHQAMEQQVISVAKAGIVTQFQSKTSVLSAANPKLGRFDPNIPPAQQFNISPALLSRFDLIFTIKDVLDETRDRKMADHILAGHKLAANKNVGVQETAIRPLVDIEILRKYIAYSRRSVYPQLSVEAADKIKEYYVELRRMGEKDRTFPVTARQIEGIIRLAEASAKMRLSETVDLQDAERSIAMVDFVLHDVFIDKTTGKIDSDIISIGQPKSRIDRQRTVIGIIESMEKKVDAVSIEDVLKECSTFGLEEIYTRKLIEEMMRQGDFYAPKPGFIRSTRKKAV